MVSGNLESSAYRGMVSATGLMSERVDAVGWFAQAHKI
jgi:hypothetical protein